jgi:hypothetical protein
MAALLVYVAGRGVEADPFVLDIEMGMSAWLSSPLSCGDHGRIYGF